MLAQKVSELIGNTPILKIESLSKLTGCELFLKCESLNPGGSIKDRASLQMIQDAISQGHLKPGMSIVEGTAGNTGVGISLVAKSFGLNSLIVMPKGQAVEKENLIKLYGGELKLVEPTSFKDSNHFYHTARAIAEENPKKYWWANQFENLSNYTAHYSRTGPEIYKVFGDELTHIVSVAGTGGTLAGVSSYYKEVQPKVKAYLVDPGGSGLNSYYHTGNFVSEGSSFSEGIGIMRLTENFKKANLDDSFSLVDEDAVCISRYLQEQDGIVLGTSAALNVAGMFKVALHAKKKSKLISFLCDQPERSYAKLYCKDFLADKGIFSENLSIDALITKYR